MKSFGMTNIGHVRLKNDDTFYCSDGKKGIYIVADGMGGYKGGHHASKIAVQCAVNIFKKYDELDEKASSEVISDIQRHLKTEIKKNKELRDMGTTFIGCLSQANRLTCMHIGDSRAYLISKDGIKQLTEDHTLVNILYKNGVINKEEMRIHPKRNILMRSLNADDAVQADLFHLELFPGEYLLLCSDGLTDPLTQEMILQIFKKSKNVKTIGEALVNKALKNGGNDNIAVVVIKG